MTTIPAGTYNIDPAHSELGFAVRHGGISRVRGRFTGFTGTININEDFAQSSVAVQIEAGSVTTGNAQRDGHLVSPDFWDAATTPTWTYESTAVEGSGAEFVVQGNLTANGITKPVVLNVEYNGTGQGIDGSTIYGFTVEAELSRKEFGLTWNAALEGGGLLVGDKVKLTLEIEAVPAA